MVDNIIYYFGRLNNFYNFQIFAFISLLFFFIIILIFIFTNKSKKKITCTFKNELLSLEKEKSIFKKWSHIDIAECEKNGTLEKEYKFYPATVMVIHFISFAETTKDKNDTEKKELINLYYKTIDDCIQKTGGVIYNFSGWELSAVWGIFGTSGSPDHDALNCIRSALMIRMALCEINKKHNNPIRIFCTISSGDIYAGCSEISKETIQNESVQKCSWAMFGTPLSSNMSQYNNIDIMLTAYTRRLVKQFIITQEVQPQQFALINLRSTKAKQPPPATLEDVEQLIINN